MAQIKAFALHVTDVGKMAVLSPSILYGLPSQEQFTPLSVTGCSSKQSIAQTILTKENVKNKLPALETVGRSGRKMVDISGRGVH